MENKINCKALLLIDGAALEKYILSQKEEYIPQRVLKLIQILVNEIKYNEGIQLDVHYSGARGQSVTSMKTPITEKEISKVDIKSSLNTVKLKEANFTCSWGKTLYSSEMPWLMRPSAYNKNYSQLTDADFELQKQIKGVQTRLVDKIAEETIKKEYDQIFFFGDEKELNYAIKTSSAWGMAMVQLKFDDNKRVEKIRMGFDKMEAIFNPEKIFELKEKYHEKKNSNEEKTNFTEELKKEREKNKNNGETYVLVDIGQVRKTLEENGYNAKQHNIDQIMPQILQQIKEKKKVDHAIIYHAYTDKKILSNPKDAFSEQAFSKLEFDAKNIGVENLHTSTGGLYQNPQIPYCLKKEKWATPHSERTKEDFYANVKQVDVDDRIAYDMAVLRMLPNVKEIVLLSSDGDFVYSVKQAKKVGVKTTLLCFDEDSYQLSGKLKKEVDEIMCLDFSKMTILPQELHDNPQPQPISDQQKETAKKKNKPWYKEENEEAGKEKDYRIIFRQEERKKRRSREKQHQLNHEKIRNMKLRGKEY